MERMGSTAKRRRWVFLMGGFLYGGLFGFGIFYFVDHRPVLEIPVRNGSGVASPSGPMAPTQVGPGQTGDGSGAPMMAEITALKERVDQDPGDLRALTRLANLYHDAGMWPRAVDFYKKALEIAPQDSDLLTDLGICYQQLRQYEEALLLFDRARSADPSHWESLYNTVVVAGLNLGDFDRAEAALKELEEGWPSTPRLEDLRQALARARLASGGGGGP